MFLTLHAAAAALRLGRFSPVELLDACLDRIDRHESWVRAWVLVDRAAAREQAEAAAVEFASGHRRGPLHGLPIGIKDIFDVFDWPTAAGSSLWGNSVARQDATVVHRLRQAGAVFVGKTVTTQYASFDPPPTANPWGVGRTPGGSSSGSAAATACGMCLAALGSQTGGSITRPASYCGVFGLKPTYTRVSCHGVVPLAPSMDHPGPMARCVHDLAVLLQTIAGPDPLDPGCAERGVPDYIAALNPPRRAPYIGRLRGPFEDLADGVTREFMDESVERLRRAGADVVDVALPAAFSDVLARHRVLMAVEAAQFHEPRLRRHPGDYLPRIRSLIEEGLACPAPVYAAAKEHQRELSRAMLGCFDGVDVLLSPATTEPAPPDDTTGNPAFNSPWSYAGLPTLSLPSGRSPQGLPLSLQLAARPWGEPGLLAAAAWIEEHLEIVCEDPLEGRE